MSSLTKRLKAAIDGSSLSYDEIEEKLGLPGGTVKKWLGGKESPDTETVKAVAALTGVSADSILFGVDKIGEMKAMFPNDTTPDNTPISDWRFLLGAVMVFTGAAGVLLMVMRYAAEGLSMGELLSYIGLPVYLLGGIALLGIVLCIVSCIISLRIPKKKNKDKK